MPVLDLHSHVLPGIDDGSPDVETSLEMLRLSAQQGVEAMVATPHFYAWRNRVERFLRRRQRAFEQLVLFECRASKLEDDGHAVEHQRDKKHCFHRLPLSVSICPWNGTL